MVRLDARLQERIDKVTDLTSNLAALTWKVYQKTVESRKVLTSLELTCSYETKIPVFEINERME